MKISYRRTGGFAGMTLSYDIDVDTLSSEEAKEIDVLVASANFFKLPLHIQAETPGLDQFQYTLSIETKEVQHTVEFGEVSMPDNLRPLVDKIRILSRSTRNQ
jgi:hypothetical protein